MNTEGIYLCGGSKMFGSGKVVAFLRERLYARRSLLGFIETQGARFEIFKAIWVLPRGAHILFQPSICFPAFLRDVVIVVLMRLRGLDITYILLVDVVFKNPLLYIGFFRFLFFGRSMVLGLAAFSQPIAKTCQLPPYFDAVGITRLLTMNLDGPMAVLHLGYRIDMKGWSDLQTRLRAETRVLRTVAIGGKVTEAESVEAAPIELLPGASTSEIEASLKMIARECLPIYLFLSREDFAPLMVLEAGYWGVPIVTIRGIRAHGILARMLPPECFVVVENFGDIVDCRSDVLRARQSMILYLEGVGRKNLLDAVSQHLGLRPECEAN